MRDWTSFDPCAQRGEIGGEPCAKTGGDDFDIAVKAGNYGVGVRRQPYDAPCDVYAIRPRWRAQQPLVQGGPGFRQTVAHEQHDVGAHARFAGGCEHDAGFAKTVEVPQQGRRMHVLDDAADPFSERNGRPGPVDIRTEPGKERLMASRQKSSRGRGRFI